ncbi:hypothetical protein FEE59_14555 [Herbaspirillum sp. RU 5E]|nr:hypothetical protein [Herbaspirillum sp. RU 5E]MRT31411.1 hypothetical protein [Herbaspirillum sp. CAH-3]
MTTRQCQRDQGRRSRRAGMVADGMAIIEGSVGETRRTVQPAPERQTARWRRGFLWMSLDGQMR